MNELTELANAFKALSNPNRLRIYLEILTRRSTQIEAQNSGCSLSDFMASLNVGAPTVSHHVKELVNANLISVERHGKFMTCYLNDRMRQRLSVFFAGHETGAQGVEHLLARLD